MARLTPTTSSLRKKHAKLLARTPVNHPVELVTSARCCCCKKLPPPVVSRTKTNLSACAPIFIFVQQQRQQKRGGHLKVDALAITVGVVVRLFLSLSTCPVFREEVAKRRERETRVRFLGGWGVYF